MNTLKTATVGGPFARFAEMVRCPQCGDPMRFEHDAFVCDGCPGSNFAIEGGILRALPERPGDRQRQVASYYDRHPFPDYDEGYSLGRLIEESFNDPLFDALNRALAPNGTIIDVGCGTGHLGNFLGVVGRGVLGIDLSWQSLLRAQAFNRASGRGGNVVFAQMDLMTAPIAPGVFDAAICDCVLQDTGEPEQAFRAAMSLVKPGGFVVVRSYNRLARLPYRLRCRAAALPRPFRDTGYSMDAVLRWFERGGVRFTRSIPAARAGVDDELDYGRSLFDPLPAGSRLDRLAVQFRMLADGDDSGCFVMVGRKR